MGEASGYGRTALRKIKPYMSICTYLQSARSICLLLEKLGKSAGKFCLWYLLILTCSLVSGCFFTSQGIDDEKLRDRVVACGAGLSDETLLSLQASYNAKQLNAQGNADFKTVAQEIIFSQLPEKDRLRAYEDYIKCIESPDLLKN